MLARARAREVYDELVKGELTAFLRDAAGAFDVIVSADTLVYFGPLEEVVAAAATALRPGGQLIFTVEELTEPRRGGLLAQLNGRYRHTRAYVERVLADAGLAVGDRVRPSFASRRASRSRDWWCEARCLSRSRT